MRINNEALTILLKFTTEHIVHGRNHTYTEIDEVYTAYLRFMATSNPESIHLGTRKFNVHMEALGFRYKRSRPKTIGISNCDGLKRLYFLKTRLRPNREGDT